MAIQTIAEADQYTVNAVYAGVVDTIIEESPILAFMQFMEVRGASYQWLRELTIPEGEFFSPGATWTEDTPTTTPVNTPLKILGKDADVDNFLRATRGNFTDLRAEAIARTAKGVARTFQNELIYGAVATDPKGFDGLHVQIPASQELAAGSTTNGGPGTFQLLDQLIDLVKPRPDVLMMGRRAKRGIQTLARSQGSDLALLNPVQPGINRPIHYYGEIPIVINDHLAITENVVDGKFDAKTGDDTESIFAIRFAEDGYHGIHAEGGLQVEPVGTLETKDAIRDRIKWYAASVNKGTLSAASLSGIDNQAWTN